MQSDRPEEKDSTSITDKDLSKLETIVTVLFVFASWVIGKYSIPGLNKRIVEYFCAQRGIPIQLRNVCCTVLDIEVSDNQEQSAQNAGVTLIPARRKSTLDPKRHPPKLEWLVNHEIHYPTIRALENVQYVVGHDSLTAEAAKDIRDSLFPKAELHLLDLPGVLVVFDNWDIDKYGLPEFHRHLFKYISSKAGRCVKVYATLLDVEVSDAQREDAEDAGITLIPGKRAEYLDPESDPIRMHWLFHHRSYYRDLKELKNIQYVIGYAPMTAFAAADIRKTLFPEAKLYQINAIHPDRHAKVPSNAQSKLEGDMLRIAKESDAMVSIGPSMYGYFDNAYRAIAERVIPHIELLPKVGECFEEQTIEIKENIEQHVILSYEEISCYADIVSSYCKMAESIGRVATTHNQASGQLLKWNILGIPTQCSEKVEQLLSELLACDFEVAKVKSPSSRDQIQTHLRQSHICVTGLRHADFGFCGLEAIAAGLPTYVNRDSQLGTFIIKYLSDFEDRCLVYSEQEWYDKMMSAIKNTPRAFKQANELKSAYYKCEEVNQSYARFAALFNEGEEPSEDLPVTIELDAQQWKQHLKELIEQREMVLRQRPDDQTTLDALTQDIQKVKENLLRCKQSLKRKADQMIEDEFEELKRLCCEANVGVNQVTKITKGSLRILLNFLSILGLCRFKSSVQTGRFAELYEPWLITDEMREIAAKVNLPLKLQVTYDEKKFDELDAFFIERDGSISDCLRNIDGENGYRFVKQPQPSLLVEQQPLRFNKANTYIEEKIPLASRLVLFKHERVLQSQRVTTQSLPRILNIGNSADIKHIACDVIQAPVEVTERIRHILLAKQEILSLLGIRAFLVTDMEDGQLTTEALDAQFETHSTKVSAITTTNRSLLVRGLLLFDISQPKVRSCCDLCFLDLEQTGRQRDRKMPLQILKSQDNKGGEGKYPLEKQYEEILKELEKVSKEAKHLRDELDNSMEDRNEVEKQREQAKQEAEVFETQLDQVKEGKSVLEKLCQERLEELAKVEEIASEKVIEIASLKKKIHNLETKLAESSDSMTKMQAQLSNAETELAESRDLVAKMKVKLSDAETEVGQSKELVTKMQVKLSDAETEVGQSKELVTKIQAKLSDAENKALESDTLKDQLDKTKKEVAQLIDQLEIAVQEKDEIQEELDREKKEKSLPQAAGTDTSKLEKGVKEEVDSGGVFSRLKKFVTGDSGPKPIGTKRYVGKKENLDRRHGGHKWTLQVLGGEESGTEPGQFNFPKGLAWRGDQLVICDTENHRIQILNKNKVVIEIIRFDGQFDKEFKPLDVAISPDGHFFITDIGNNQIIICDQNKKIILIIPQSADIEARSITVMAAFIFVTDSKGKSLIKYNIKDGKLVARLTDQISFPYSVMATSNNHLLVSDFNKHVIHVLDSDMNLLNSYRNDRLKSPRGLDVDLHGNIYIYTWPSYGIVKLRSDGQLDCVLFEGDRYFPEFIAVNDDITTTIAVTAKSLFYQSVHQIRVYSVST